MTIGNRSLDAALPQLLQDMIHGVVAVVVVTCTTILAASGHVPADVTGAVFTGVIGYVAGRSGNISRAVLTRASDERDG